MKTAIVSIVRDEIYLRDFVNYHRAIGFDKICLIQDNKSVIPAIVPGAVTVIKEPGLNQMQAYNNVFEYFPSLRNYDWLLFLDADEYLVLSKGFSKIQDVMHLYRNSQAVGINWRMFSGGSMNLELPPWGRCKCRIPDNDSENLHVKTIVRPTSLLKWQNPHNPVLITGALQTDTNRNHMSGPYSKQHYAKVMTIHHYHSASLPEYMLKFYRGRVDTQIRRENFDYHYYLAKSTIYDISLIEIMRSISNFTLSKVEG
jgi:hypothetical protein